MDKFFGQKYHGEQLTVFSTVHILMLLFLIVTNFLIFWILKKDRFQNYRNIARYVIAFIMLFHSVSFEVWSICVKDFTIKYSLPLHMCDVAVILAALMLFTKSRFLFEVTYFWGLGASFLALLTPDITQSFPHFIFFNYFLSHGGIITCVLYMIVIEKYSINFKSILKVFIFTNVYMVIIAGVNKLLGSNYLYICRKPSNPTLFDFLGPWPWYIISLEGVAIVAFFILYLPYAIKGLGNSNKPMNLNI